MEVISELQGVTVTDKIQITVHSKESSMHKMFYSLYR